MPARRQIGGYVFNGEVARARRSIQEIKGFVGDINLLVKQRTTVSAITTLLVEILLRVSEIESALREIERIAQGVVKGSTPA